MALQNPVGELIKLQGTPHVADLSGDVPVDGITQEFDPLKEHAVCFNQGYKTDFKAIDQEQLHLDYFHIFDWGFENSMGPPLESVQEDNNNITNNRFPGMMLRLCFHDNAIDADEPQFQDYINDFIVVADSNGKPTWTGPKRYLSTSGADASHLVCPQERFHPINDGDNMASRVLYALQSKNIPGIVDKDGFSTNMVDKYKLSYADLLHNGCIAAVNYVSPSKERQGWSSDNPMKFGRKDACYYDWDSESRSALCGPSELLPGSSLTTRELNNWFYNRGMTPCQFMALMWTHTMMATLGKTCPLMHLPFTEDGIQLDYFSHFLQPGTHIVSSVATIKALPDDPNCVWTVSGETQECGNMRCLAIVRPPDG